MNLQTPTSPKWYIDNGAVMFNGAKQGSAVLVVNPKTGEPGILVQDTHFQHEEMLDLNQPGLLTLVYQLMAAFTAEHYPSTERTVVRTDVDHVWQDQVTLWYYYTDEASLMVGPYRTKQHATERLNWYCQHVLGN